MVKRQAAILGRCELSRMCKGAALGAGYGLVWQNTHFGRQMQVKDIAFLDTDTLFWQLAQQHSLQYQAHSRAGIPNLGEEHLHITHSQNWSPCNSSTALSIP